MHVPFDDMPLWKRILQGLAALREFRNATDRTDLVLRASLLLQTEASRERILSIFMSSEEGRYVLDRRPGLDTVDLDALLKLPPDTLGFAYAKFLKDRGLTVDLFVMPLDMTVRDDNKLYIFKRMRQTHDLWHVVCGYDTDDPGEVELQGFYFGQVRTLFSFFVALGAKASFKALPRVWRAYRRGRRAKHLCHRAWEKRFQMPIIDVRRELGLA